MDSNPTAVTLAIGALLGFALSHIASRLRQRPGLPSIDYDDLASDEDVDAPAESPRSSSARGEYKMVLCVRTDLKMSKGKMAAQCGHAALGAYQDALRHSRALVLGWERGGQAKIALQVKSVAQVRELERQARLLKVPTHAVIDAGRTQIAAGSLTVLAVGPAPVDLIDRITGHLKLL